MSTAQVRELALGLPLEDRARLARELLESLESKQKREALLALAAGDATKRDARRSFAESQLRQIAAEKGLDWDQLGDEEREILVNDLVHENRSCPS